MSGAAVVVVDEAAVFAFVAAAAAVVDRQTRHLRQQHHPHYWSERQRAADGWTFESNDGPYDLAAVVVVAYDGDDVVDGAAGEIDDVALLAEGDAAAVGDVDEDVVDDD